MEGRIEKHTLSSVRILKEPKHTHTSRPVRECRESGMHRDTAAMLGTLRFQGSTGQCYHTVSIIMAQIQGIYVIMVFL